MELTPEETDRVKEIRLALEQEMRTTEDEEINTRKTVMKEIEDLKVDALESLRHTIKHSQNETLKTKVSMWAIDLLLDTAKTSADEPIVAFLKGMDAAKVASGT